MNTSTTAQSTASSHATQAAEDPQSQATVDVSDKASIDRWAKALGTTDEALMNAVKSVGTRIDKIKDFLGAGGMAGKQSGG
ncbi:MAG TPA: DUF3606 domain-containing protein [Ideonella sp.]|uniref:DUF3606 domain-containing protein n=1 Tax=Ideonella sp. TaxID=1929293 RepID=UPI002E2FC11E|nr:DUF3606 domain-containing protein [Ideonella sp.]HEX5686255.1 DUF3606 domain-containing protein [Ideonella sp.]